MSAAPPSLDLDAYFARIGYSGPRTTTYATLAGIHASHAQTIPFENLDILLGRRIAIDLPSIERKLVHDRRGVRTSGVIVEVEAYIGESDPACHAARGPMTRNASLYDPTGYAYVYVI